MAKEEVATFKNLSSESQSGDYNAKIILRDVAQGEKNQKTSAAYGSKRCRSDMRAVV